MSEAHGGERGVQSGVILVDSTDRTGGMLSQAEDS